MKWEVGNTRDAHDWFMIVDAESKVGCAGGFRTRADAERAVADHNTYERFADPVKAIELLMTLAERAAANKGVRHMAKRICADPALQPPGDAT